MRIVLLITASLMFLCGAVLLAVCADSIVREWWKEFLFSGLYAVFMGAVGMTMWAKARKAS